MSGPNVGYNHAKEFKTELLKYAVGVGLWYYCHTTFFHRLFIHMFVTTSESKHFLWDCIKGMLPIVIEPTVLTKRERPMMYSFLTLCWFQQICLYSFIAYSSWYSWHLVLTCHRVFCMARVVQRLQWLPSNMYHAKE